MSAELGKLAQQILRERGSKLSEKDRLYVESVALRGMEEALGKPNDKEFTPEIRELLEKDGFVIYSLTGRSIADLKEEGNFIDIVPWVSNRDNTLHIPSRQTEVAFHPDPKRFFLEGSSEKTELEQQILLLQFSRQFETSFPGTKVIKGEGADFIELALRYYEDSKKRLFGKKYGYRYTRTNSSSGGHGLVVGRYINKEFSVGVGSSGEADKQLGLAYLVVPA